MKTKAIINARIVTPDQIIDNHVLIVHEGIIAGLIPAEAWVKDKDFKIIDAEGAWLMPGFIDIHADYIEHMAAPRPTSMMDFTLALREAEKELVCHGVTTMFHSLSFYGESDFGSNPVRSPENVSRLMQVIEDIHQGEHLIRHRFHARLEIDSLSSITIIRNAIAAGKIHLLSFMDHTPGQGQYRNLEIFRKSLKGYRNLDDQAIDTLIAQRQAKERLSFDSIAELARFALDHHVSVASHDDDSVDKIELVKSYGSSICEFPITLDVAHAAQQAGMFTVAGAPNIVLGGSHSGNLSAAEAIQAGAIDCLCSDYYPAALLHGVFKMVQDYGQDLPAMVRLLCTNPAKAVGMGDVIGSIKAGLKADLVLVKQLADGFPAIERVIIDGTTVYQANYRRNR